MRLIGGYDDDVMTYEDDGKVKNGVKNVLSRCQSTLACAVYHGDILAVANPGVDDVFDVVDVVDVRRKQRS